MIKKSSVVNNELL